MLMFISIALLVNASRRLCGVKSQILASVNSSLTHLRMESGEAGLYGFPYVTIGCLWSVRLLLLRKYSLRQATTQRSGLSQARYSSVFNLDRFLECFRGWVKTKETEMLLIIILSIWDVSKVCTLYPPKSTRKSTSFYVKILSYNSPLAPQFSNIENYWSHPIKS